MNRPISKWLAVVTLACLALVACDGKKDPEAEPTDNATAALSFNSSFEGLAAYPLFVNSELVVGENRVLIGVLNSDDAPIGSPDVTVTADLYDLAKDATEPVSTMDMTFEWSIEDVTGIYVGHATFDSAGTWGAEVSIQGDGLEVTTKTSFEVTETGTTPAIGAPAPASDTLKAGDKPIAELSTDLDPDPSFYEMSVADALDAHVPFVLVFATPKFCTSAVCGPTLDLVKAVSKDFPDITFIHVEPYELPANPSKLKPIDATSDWGLPSEPWVFVVDAEGNVHGKYEGIVGQDELAEELSTL